MTKKEYAEHVVRTYKGKSSVEQLVKNIYSSTSLGIALEVLDVLVKNNGHKYFGRL